MAIRCGIDYLTNGRQDSTTHSCTFREVADICPLVAPMIRRISVFSSKIMVDWLVGMEDNKTLLEEITQG